MSDNKKYTLVIRNKRVEVNENIYHSYHKAREAERYQNKLIYQFEQSIEEELIAKEQLIKLNQALPFVGYTYKVEGENIYIGLKYNTFLGFLKRDSSFNVKVDCDTDGKKYNVYIVGNQDEKLIWPIESAN